MGLSLLMEALEQQLTTSCFSEKRLEAWLSWGNLCCDLARMPVPANPWDRRGCCVLSNWSILPTGVNRHYA